MMDGIRQWLLGILAAAMGLSLLYALLPKGAVRAAAKATGGLILLLPGKKSDAQTQEGGGSFSLEDTERRMEELLGRMDGVGRVQVMLTLKNGPELELAEDADDTDRDGELRRQREPVTLNRGSGYQDVVVTRETYPVYLGAVVVCQGAGSGGVRLAVTEAVAALTGLPADRITVVQWDS